MMTRYREQQNQYQNQRMTRSKTKEDGVHLDPHYHTKKAPRHTPVPVAPAPQANEPSSVTTKNVVTIAAVTITMAIVVNEMYKTISPEEQPLLDDKVSPLNTTNENINNTLGNIVNQTLGNVTETVGNVVNQTVKNVTETVASVDKDNGYCEEEEVWWGGAPADPRTHSFCDATLRCLYDAYDKIQRCVIALKEEGAPDYRGCQNPAKVYNAIDDHHGNYMVTGESESNHFVPSTRLNSVGEMILSKYFYGGGGSSSARNHPVLHHGNHI